MSERFDRFYLALENRVRGSTDHIRQGQSVFLPVFRRCHSAVIENSLDACPPVLDIGCGRGEWLDLLKDAAIPCQGLDMNRDMAALCVERGHQAIQGNALDVLKTLPDASLLGVTAFHVVEHISPESALELLAEIYRCLVPGGIALFETPNPENIRTATHHFFLDPTHLRPIPPMLLQFMFEFSGFTGNEIVRLRPVRDKAFRSRLASPASRFMMRHFLKEQDYAVIGVKGPVPPGLLPAV